MDSIFSQKEPGLILHRILDTRSGVSGRVDLSDPVERLQTSAIALEPGRQVKPHVHLPRDFPALPQGFTQETWIVLRGSLEAQLYDIDRTHLAQRTLVAGMLLVTFRGGHGLVNGPEESLIIECKTGPYLGRDYEVIAP